ncbi:hypothetical protein GFS31_22900 [Leptolyngbya sp. BL0902]|uniref:hypothetical protein n=1 Tax=Leptolyngbya sp. BL0902 TaxID=1115757 RepID=UPI0018E77974|nr:hypothetical protein [Leptolyngbya sp. BL0902]QQE65602.1 hypothetical protein GFS31_22900 [Leptolyngbya sp. BL0902]
MGFIKSIFGIIGGVFKAILGVFGVGKKSEFFMELDEGDVAPAAAPAAAPAPAAATAVAEPVAAPAAPAAPAPKPAPAAPQSAPSAPAVPSFAANYLVGSTLPSRRRPGPSMSPFRDMAKQVQPR